MHGRLKVRTTEEQKAIKQKEQQIKLQAYRKGIDQVFSLSKDEKLDEETQKLTAHLLLANPDIYTLWNFRKQILLNNSGDSQLINQDDVKEELVLTEQCLRINPKSYGAWHHRCWVLDHCPEPNWQKELALCTKYLQLDERNFHCWDYRRFVASRANVTSESELKFSTDKICSDFSNYSSWHYRSTLYKTLSPNSDIYKNELDLVQNAAFTDPDDTSAWFYHRWLLGKCESDLEIVIFYLDQNGNLTLALNQTVGRDVIFQICINEQNFPTDWTPLSCNNVSSVWVTKLKDIDESDKITVDILKDDTKLSSITLEWIKNHVARRANAKKLGVTFGDGVKSVLEDQLQSCNELLQLEPDSKWTLLTSALLMRGLDIAKHNEKSLSLIDELKRVDSKRTNYYRDMKSKWIMENYINNRISTGALFDEVNLTDCSLTSLYHLQYFSAVQKINLTGNHLSDRSLAQLSVLSACTYLRLDNNKITELKNFPPMRSLVELSIKNNDIASINKVRSLTMCENLKILDISLNPIASHADTIDKIKCMLPNVQTIVV